LPMISRVAMLGDEPESIIIAGIKEKKYYDRDTNSEIIYPSIATYGASELLLILSYCVLDLEHISLPATVTFAAQWTKY